jgi:hypothetical protein
MPTSTQTNIASLASFLSQLAAFAVTNAGFTDEGTVDIVPDPTNGDDSTQTMYRISKTVDSKTTHWGFVNSPAKNFNTQGRSRTRVLGKMGHSQLTEATFNATSSDTQEFPTIMGTWDLAPPFTKYIFYTDGISVFAILEVTAGVYAHMAFGHVTKNDTWPGGAYLTANNYQRDNLQSYIGPWRDIGRLNDFASQIFGSVKGSGGWSTGASYLFYDLGTGDFEDFLSFGSVRSYARGVSGTMAPSLSGNFANYDEQVNSYYACNPYQRTMRESCPTTFTFRSPIFPILMFRQAGIGTTAGTADYQWEPLGRIPNIGMVNLQVLADEEIVDDSWQVFPLTRTTVSSGTTSEVANYSGIWGVAYKSDM